MRLCVRLCGSGSPCQSRWNSSLRNCTARDVSVVWCVFVCHFLQKVERSRGQDLAPHMNEKYFRGREIGSPPHFVEGFFGIGSCSHKNRASRSGRRVSVMRTPEEWEELAWPQRQRSEGSRSKATGVCNCFCCNLVLCWVRMLDHSASPSPRLVESALPWLRLFFWST